MKMKITQNDFMILTKIFDSGIEKIGLNKILDHKKLNLGSDVKKRFRWDLLWAVFKITGNGFGIDETLNFDYLNDDHIDTAIKKIVKNNLLLN